MRYEKTLRKSIVDKKEDEKESEELKKIYNHYLDKTKGNVQITQYKVEDIFGAIVSKDNYSQEQAIKLINFSAKLL